jgi:lysozyme
MSKYAAKKHKQQKITRNSSVLAIALFCCVILGTLFFVHNNAALAEAYPIKGFDVSHHQGDIDWKKISPQHYQFVYLKATEGGDYQDDKFQQYWLEARERGMRVGAYHYFRLCRDVDIQAQNFIKTVPNKSNALPPVMDLEYDSSCINIYTKEQLIKHIKSMHDQLQKHYGKQPIFYTSKIFYNMVLTGEFKDTPIWIREYKDKPDLKDQRAWTFWQQSNQGKIQGIEKNVDLNVFYGDAEQWQQFLQKNKLN